MDKKDKNWKYIIKSNNYVGLLFFALVFASCLYILKSEDTMFKELEPKVKEIEEVEVPIIKDSIDEEITKYLRYLNKGSEDTYKIYQSTYIKDGIKVENIDIESLLYMSYKYLKEDNEYNKTRNLTCEEAKLINIDQNIVECGGNTNNLASYQVSYSINRQLLKKTIRDLYNININDFIEFYTYKDNKCYLVDNEYLCVTFSNNSLIEDNINHGETEFIKAYYYDDHIEIIEKYKYINNGINYVDINSLIEGEETYVSVFNKINSNYYYSETYTYSED